MSYSRIGVRPLSGALGAEISGADLAHLDAAAFDEVRQAFWAHGVICCHDQQLSHGDLVAFARRFGALDVHPIVEGTAEIPELVRVWKPAGEAASFGTGWHSDNSFFPQPSLGSLLYGVTIPPYGGDTLFASMERAYEALSAPMRDFLGGLRAIHSASRAYDPRVTGAAKYRGEAPMKYRYSEIINEEVEHPVIRTHPQTGRKSVYVNQMFTQRIVALSEPESGALLRFLYAHCTQPDFTCRVRWAPGTVTLWDNRCVQHYALDDYRPFERLMYRVTVSGERPA